MTRLGAVTLNRHRWARLAGVRGRRGVHLGITPYSGCQVGGGAGGQVVAARREVRGAADSGGSGRWSRGTAGQAVAFWPKLPGHGHGTPVQMGRALRRLHDSAPPVDLGFVVMEPSVRLAERISGAAPSSREDRDWMREREGQWQDRPAGMPERVVHGDTWVGDVVATRAGEVVDLERTAAGQPERDLVRTEITSSSFGRIGRGYSVAFSDAYGHDVADRPGSGLFRDLREFRMTCMAAHRRDSGGTVVHGHDL